MLHTSVYECMHIMYIYSFIICIYINIYICVLSTGNFLDRLFSDGMPFIFQRFGAGMMVDEGGTEGVNEGVIKLPSHLIR